jgi:bifunctional non-homologous end joining protein LigD
LAELVAAADTEHIQYSGAFTDPAKILATCERMSLEGIVSKRKDSAYRPGRTQDWLKVETEAWRAANADRYALLHRQNKAKMS